MVREFGENRTRIPLKSLAIPAGFEPATHGVEIRYSEPARLALRPTEIYRMKSPGQTRIDLY
jgi:hypothetical protein